MSRTAAIQDLSRGLVLNCMFVCIFSLLLQATATAHELRPAIVDATIDKAGGFEVRASMNLEAWLAGIGGDHTDTAQSANAPLYDRLRARVPAVLATQAQMRQDELVAGLQFTAGSAGIDLKLVSIDVPPIGDVGVSRTTLLSLSGQLPAEGQSIIWQADKRLGDTVIRLWRKGEDTPFYSTLISAGASSPEISLNGVFNRTVFDNLLSYAVVGFEHIIPKGLDHILFVVGLFLLSPYLRPLLWQVTGFTLAHTLTLALGIYGLVSVPASIVEPLIALSIAFIAVENLFTDRLQRWRPAVVFSFGLLHGLGFAGVLAEIGLPQNQFATALIGFNVGVEVGQLAVLALCFLSVGLWFRQRSWYRPAVTMPASALVALIAMGWFVERIA